MRDGVVTFNFKMITTENIEISKLYSFRIKTKYRYGFGGSDTIWVVPSERFYYPEESVVKASFFGDMAFNLKNKAESYTLKDKTLSMKRGNYGVNSTVFDLGGDFLHIIEFKSDKGSSTKSCKRDSDCIDLDPTGHCSNSECHYNRIEKTTSNQSLELSTESVVSEIKGIELTSAMAENQTTGIGKVIEWDLNKDNENCENYGKDSSLRLLVFASMFQEKEVSGYF